MYVICPLQETNQNLRLHKDLSPKTLRYIFLNALGKLICAYFRLPQYVCVRIFQRYYIYMFIVLHSNSIQEASTVYWTPGILRQTYDILLLLPVKLNNNTAWRYWLGRQKKIIIDHQNPGSAPPPFFSSQLIF